MTTLPLEGKVALVTGGGSGIGRGIALRLAEAGAAVAVGYVGPSEGARETVARFPRPEAGMIVAADIRDRQQVEAMVAEVAASRGRLDVMACNAGLYHAASVLDVEEANWREVIDVNLTGTFLCAQAAARHMVAQGTGGRIIVTASTQGVRPNRGPLAYGVSKAALVALVRGLALELAPHRISAVAVSPGVMEAAGNIRSLAEPERRRTVEAQIPLGRVGRPRDIGEVVAFLASDAADYISGANIPIDGGLLLAGPQI